MSKIGKKLIPIPEGVVVDIQANQIKVTGPKGELSFPFRSAVAVSKKDHTIIVAPIRTDKFGRSLWGTIRTKIANAILGVTEGFIKKLEFTGVGFRANVEKEKDRDKLVLSLGFSHPVEILTPKSITLKLEKNIITIEGIDKEQVGEVAAEIRRTKLPEPYKGKGIKYLGEQIRRKVGKADIKTGEGA